MHIEIVEVGLEDVEEAPGGEIPALIVSVLCASLLWTTTGAALLAGDPAVSVWFASAAAVMTVASARLAYWEPVRRPLRRQET